MIVAGIDEAGKGPVIGPMVVCLFEVEEEKLAELKKAGATDSKLLSEKRREEILERLENLGRARLLVISAAELDARGESLNTFEIGKMAQLISMSRAEKIWIDSIEANGKKLGEKVLARISGRKPEIIAKPKADRDFPIVGAASIAAKVRREKEIEKLKKEYGDFGSGYPSDPRTKAFLKRFLAEKGFLPAIVRKSWATTERLLGDYKQSKLEG
jgi:ribonuclease HII